MAEREQWIVGSAPDCDIVIDRPNVSGHHCRLERTGEAYWLEDLKSTNGTYVNGKKVEARMLIVRSDAITLGSNASFPWDQVPAPAPASVRATVPSSAPGLRPGGPATDGGVRIVTIGREPDNDIVLDDPSVSGRHARVTIEHGVAILEDLGSTNGTILGSTGRRVTRSQINPSDEIHFGSVKFSAAKFFGNRPAMQDRRAVAMTQQLPSMSNPDYVLGTNPPPRTPMVRTGTWSSSSDNLLEKPAVLGGIAAAVGACLLLLVLWGMGAFRSATPSAPAKGDVSDLPNKPPATETTDAQQPPAKPLNNTTAAATTSTPTASREAALYLVIVSNPESDNSYQLGTAWAIGKRKLATSGAIVRALQSRQKEFPRAAVLCRASKLELPLSAVTAHPRYLELIQLADEKRSAVEKLRAELQETKGEEPEKIKELTDQIVELQEQAFPTLDTLAFFDVGLLDVEQDLPVTLNLAKESSAPRPSSKVTLAGIPLVFGDVSVDRQALAPPHESDGQIRIVRYQIGTQGGPRLLGVKCGLDLSDQNWSGSPVFNLDGEVVGIYSRPTVPPLVPGPASNVVTHDVAEIARIRELAPDLK